MRDIRPVRRASPDSRAMRRHAPHRIRFTSTLRHGLRGPGNGWRRPRRSRPAPNCRI